MSHRVALSLSMLLFSVVACADEHAATVAVVQFSNRCFDAARLVERMKRRAVALTIVSMSAQAPGHEVEVRDQSPALEVRVTMRDAGARIVGVEVRHLPADTSCESLLETTELIVARAAMPLRYYPSPSSVIPPAAVPRVRRTTPVRDSPAPPEISAPTNDDDGPPTRTPPDPEIVRPIAPHIVVETAHPVVDRVAPRFIRRFELDVHALWLFPLDHVPSTPAVDVSIGYRWSRNWGLVLRTGVAGSWQASDVSDEAVASVVCRRIPLVLALALDLPIRRGGFRLAVGPLLALWWTRSAGIIHPDTRVLIQPGAQLRASYRIDVKRFAFEAGVNLNVGFTVQDIVIAGLGSFTHTPVVDLSPFVGIGVRL